MRALASSVTTCCFDTKKGSAVRLSAAEDCALLPEPELLVSYRTLDRAGLFYFQGGA